MRGTAFFWMGLLLGAVVGCRDGGALCSAGVAGGAEWSVQGTLQLDDTLLDVEPRRKGIEPSAPCRADWRQGPDFGEWLRVDCNAATGFELLVELDATLPTSEAETESEDEPRAAQIASAFVLFAPGGDGDTSCNMTGDVTEESRRAPSGNFRWDDPLPLSVQRGRTYALSLEPEDGCDFPSASLELDMQLVAVTSRTLLWGCSHEEFTAREAADLNAH